MEEETLDEQRKQAADWLRVELDLLFEEELAAAIGVKPQTLAVWRGERFGPNFVKLGKQVFYRREDVKAWITKCLIRADGIVPNTH